RTLRATLEWSYELLGERERSGLARFAVFRGGCTADALEAICDADLAVAAALIDKSLLRRIDGRLEMLETIRQFAAERLEEGGERDEMRRRHAQYFLAAAEQAAPETSVGNEQALWLERM